MLEAKTKEQLSHIIDILDDWNVCVYGDTIEEGTHIDDFIPFECMAEIVDYLRASTPSK